MSWVIFWLVCAIVACLVMNFSAIKKLYKKLEKLEHLMPPEIYAKHKKELAEMRWIIRRYWFFLLFGPFALITAFIMYRKNITLYFKVPN